jgi:hypothetical protein
MGQYLNMSKLSVSPEGYFFPQLVMYLRILSRDTEEVEDVGKLSGVLDFATGYKAGAPPGNIHPGPRVTYSSVGRVLKGVSVIVDHPLLVIVEAKKESTLETLQLEAELWGQLRVLMIQGYSCLSYIC